MHRGVLKFSIAAVLSFDPFYLTLYSSDLKKIFGTEMKYGTIIVRAAGRKSRNTYKSEEEYAIS